MPSGENSRVKVIVTDEEVMRLVIVSLADLTVNANVKNWKLALSAKLTNVSGLNNGQSKILYHAPSELHSLTHH
jgi:hypothetical protein